MKKEMNTQNLKTAHKAALLALLSTESRLLPVPNTGDLQIYVKRLTVEETNQILEKTKEFAEKYNDEFSNERTFALEFFDSEGKLYFDPENPDDMRLLQLLPPIVRLSMQQATLSANGGDVLKNLLTTEQSS